MTKDEILRKYGISSSRTTSAKKNTTKLTKNEILKKYGITSRVTSTKPVTQAPKTETKKTPTNTQINAVLHPHATAKKEPTNTQINAALHPHTTAPKTEEKTPVRPFGIAGDIAGRTVRQAMEQNSRLAPEVRDSVVEAAKKRLSAAENALDSVMGLNTPEERQAVYDEYNAAVENYELATGKKPYHETFTDFVTAGQNALIEGLARGIDFGTNIVDRGLTQVAQSGANFADMILGNAIKGVGKLTGNDWDDNVISSSAQQVRDNSKRLVEETYRIAEGNELLTGAADIVSSAIAAAPAAVLAYFTGGGATTAGLTATSTMAQTPGMMGTISHYASGFMKNPNYWHSVMMESGSNYEEALSWARSPEEAAMYATIVGLINGGVELGLDGASGIQGFEQAVRKGNGGALRQFVESMFDEGKEEVVQGQISRALAGAMGSGAPAFSLTDENAVFNPVTSAKEFGSGAAVAALLQGGQIAGQMFSDPSFDITAAEAPSKYAPDPALLQIAREAVQNRTEAESANVPSEAQSSAPEVVQGATRESVLAAAKTTLGAEGYKAFETELRDDVEPATAYHELTRAYNDGMAGKKRVSPVLTSDQYDAMYDAGQADIEASIKAQIEQAGKVTSYGEQSGLDYADQATKEYVAKAIDKKTTKTLDTVAKALGVKVRFADSVDGGNANAEIENGIITIEKYNKNPVRFLMGHEITHRMQELAPAEYARLREAVAQSEKFAGLLQEVFDAYAAHNRSISQEKAIDEAVANYVGALMDDKGELERFISKHKDDNKLIKWLRDKFRELANKLPGVFKRQASEVEKRLTEVLDAAVVQAQKNTVQENGGPAKQSKKLGGYADVRVDVQAEINFFGVKALNDYVGVQKTVYNKLLETGFLDKDTRRRSVENADTGIVVEIGRDGINETFGPGDRYAHLPAELKRFKIATVRYLPDIIRYGEVVETDQPNLHNLNSDLKFTYIQHPVFIGDKQYYVVVDIRQSRQTNKFWVHGVYVNAKKGQALDANADKSGSAINKELALDATLAQTKKNVNIEKEVEKRIEGGYYTPIGGSQENMLDIAEEIAESISGGKKLSIKGSGELAREIVRIEKEGRKKGRSEADIKADVRAAVEAKVDAAYLTGRMAQGRVMAKQLSTANRHTEDVKEHYKAKEAKASESKKARILRAKIMKHAKELSAKLLRPTDKKHIPQELQKAVAALLDAINLESNYELEYGKDAKYHRVKPGESPYAEATKRTQAFEKLREQYEKILADGTVDMTIDPALLGSPDSGIRSLLGEVIAMRDIPLADMTSEQLQTLWDVVRAVEHSITTAGKMLAKSKYETTASLANAFAADTGTKRNNRSGENMSGLSKALETPYTFFSHYGKAGLDFFRMLRNAQDTEQSLVDALAEKVRGIVSKEGRKKLEKSTQEFKTSLGDTLTLSKAHVMEIYLLSKRDQAKQHLLAGGIVQPKVGKIKRGADPVLLTEADIAKIIDTLTESEKAKADAMQKLTLLLAEWGNEASLKVYGYEKFNDPNYWTIRSASEQIQQTVEKGRDNPRSIANMGSAKPLTPNASNALDIGGIFNTFDRHASEMMTYSAWLATMEDANRLFNFKFKDKDGNRTGKTMQTLLNRVGGPDSTKYWIKLMTDIQNGIHSSGKSWFGKASEKVIGNVRAASVAGNLRVVIQQPTAYLRALAVLDFDCMLAALGKDVAIKPIIDGWKKALKYAPIAARKAAGGFEIGSSPAQLAEVLYAPDTKGGKVAQFIKDAPFALPGLADNMTWGTIWNACEIQVSKTNKGLKKGSAEYYEAVAELFTEVIDQTQVVDGVLQRSQAMRSSDGAEKQMTAFMGEPMLNLNLIKRAYNNWSSETDPKKRSAELKVLGRAITGVMFASVLNAFAQSIIDAGRDDEDEEYWKKVKAAFIGLRGDEETWSDFAKAIMLEGNLVNNLNPAGWIPYLKDVVSLVQGYSIERMDASAIDAFLTAVNNVRKSFTGEGKWTPGYAAAKVITTGAKLFGSSSANIMRDVESIVRTIQMSTGARVSLYETEKAKLNVTENKAHFLDILYKAYESGDKAAYDAIAADLIANGIEASDIESGMYSRAKKAGLTAADIGSVDFSAGLSFKYKVEKPEDLKYTIDSLTPEQYIEYNENYTEIVAGVVDEFKERGFDKLDKDAANELLSAAYTYAEQTALMKAAGVEVVYKTETDKNGNEKEVAYIKIDGELIKKEDSKEWGYISDWVVKAQDADDLGLTIPEWLMLREEYGEKGVQITAGGVYKAYEAGIPVDSYLDYKAGTKEADSKLDRIDYAQSMDMTNAEYNALLAHDIFTSDKYKKNLAPDEYDDFAIGYESYMDSALSSVYGDSDYAQYDKKAQGSIVSYAETYASENALYDLTGGEYDRTEWVEDISGIKVSGIELSDIFEAKYVYSTLDATDDNGKTVSGLKKKRFYEYLDSKGYTRKQKNALWEVVG